MVTPLRRRSILVLVLGAAGVLGALFGPSWWIYYRSHVSTDDAYVRADVTLITPRIAGTITELRVENNWQVKRGDLLASLDDAELQILLEETESAVAEAYQNVEAERAEVRAAESQVRLAEAELEQAQRDDARIERLHRDKVASVEDLDRTRTALRVSRARLEAAREEVARSRAALGIPLDAPADRSPAVRRAVAARDRARLMLSYADLYAPVSGIIATRSVEIGQRVQPGQSLMRIVPLEHAYVEANFKETDLADVRIGQPVSIVADIYPDTRYSGRVDSLSPGTGASFALLPPENATGNWIKVVQRVPVKIRLDTPPPPDRPLRLGLSVVTTIDVSDTSGPFLRPIDQREARR
jgi:membrane fusion protein (multidrug efflux system)